MRRVIYVTGAPATGKSTLCKTLAATDSNIETFCYSERLRDHVNQRPGIAVDEAGIREASSRVVRAEDVDAVDELLLERAKDVRASSSLSLLVDSHPVTKEDFGFRITGFSTQNLRALSIDVIICLYADPEILKRRILDAPMGRPLPTNFDLALHIQLQAAVASQYAVLIGKPCYLIDSSVSQQALVDQVHALSTSA